MYRIILFSLLFALSCSAFSQEFNARITINAQQVQTADKAIFKTLENQLTEFVNNRKWTDDVFGEKEKIEWSLIINITEELSLDEFRAQAVITTNRPVFNSSYKSTLLKHKDVDWQFKYAENLSMDYSENQHLYNLTSLVAFYAYYVLGLDYDTYSNEGGSPYFQKAQQIVNNAQNEPEDGWKSYTSTKNRYWLVENALNPRFKEFREANYLYHRVGLDQMYDDVNKGRKEVAKAITKLKSTYDDNPTSYLLSIYFKSKSDEFINIFSEAPSTERAKIFPILSQMDPSNTNNYRKLLRN